MTSYLKGLWYLLIVRIVFVKNSLNSLLLTDAEKKPGVVLIRLN